MGFELENINEHKDTFANVVMSYRDTVVRDNMALVLNVFKYITDAILTCRCLLTDELISLYYNASILYSDLISVAGASLEVMGTDDYVMVDISEFPKELVDYVSNINLLIPTFKVERAENDNSSVICSFVDGVEISDKLKEVSGYIDRVRHNVALMVNNNLTYSLVDCFYVYDDISKSQDGLRYCNESGLLLIMKSLLVKVLTDTASEVCFTRDKDDNSVDLDLLVSVINSFKGFHAECSDFEEDPSRVQLTVKFTETYTYNYTETLKELLEKVAIDEESKGKLLTLIESNVE